MDDLSVLNSLNVPKEKYDAFLKKLDEASENRFPNRWCVKSDYIQFLVDYYARLSYDERLCFMALFFSLSAEGGIFT